MGVKFAINMFSGVSVCSHISKNTRSNFTKLSVQLTCGRGPFLI